jgi:alpha-tubulin suppressor-like RCC1 family protein
MSQTKAQLVAPVGVVTASSMTVTGVLTATTLDGNVIGAAVSIAQGKNLNVGVITASGIGGDITGSATSITQGNNVTFGSLTASRLVGDLTGNAVGNALGDAVSATVTGITTTNNINVGVITATSFRGSASNLDGVSSNPVSQQAVTIDGAATSIDLSSGNLIYATQSANTTVSFANSENGNVYIIREKDATTTARTITWPDRIKWNGGSAPTLNTGNFTNEAQVFLLITRDMGVTWYGDEIYKNAGGFKLFTWGYNNYGQLGLNDNVRRSSPTQLSGTTWISMTGNGTQTLAKKSNGTLWSWGYGFLGGTAHNDQIDRSSPTQVGTDTTWNRTFPNGNWSGAATKTDGTLWVWGNNLYGVLGQNGGQPTSQSSPVQLPGTWSELSNSGGGVATIGLQTNGTLWSWGYNTYGGLGLNDVVSRSSPTQVGTQTTWKEGIGTGFGFFAAVKTDGTLWTSGFNTIGQLGLNEGSPARRSSPTQVGTNTTWNKVDSSGSSSIATKTDGTLWSWGYNGTPGSTGGGQLGLNDIIARSSPTQIPGTTWDSLLHANGGYFATKTDGTLWSWGNNYHGQLGLNQSHNLDERSSPTQIPGTWDISAINAMYSKYGGNAFQS